MAVPTEPKGARCSHGYFYGQDCCVRPRTVPSLEDEAVTERVTDVIFEVLTSTNGVASVDLSLVHLAEILAHVALTKEREIRSALNHEVPYTVYSLGGAQMRQSIVAPDVDYAITDPSDGLYNEDSSHPKVEERFQQSLQQNLRSGFYDEETVAMLRRHRAERQELSLRQYRESQANAKRRRMEKEVSNA